MKIPYALITVGEACDMDIQFHKIQELVATKEVLINYYHNKDQVVNIFTKPMKIELILQDEENVSNDKLDLREALLEIKSSFFKQATHRRKVLFGFCSF